MLLTQTDWDAVFSTDDIDKLLKNPNKFVTTNVLVFEGKITHWLINDIRKLIRFFFFFK